MKKLSIKNQKGFTLIELLVVIGILAVLLAIVLIAINPARQFAQANDTKRRNDSLQILNAVWQYAAENNGNLPAGLTTTQLEISTTGANICADLVPTYMTALPVDPSLNQSDVVNCAASYSTGYEASKSATGRVTIVAPDAQLNPISVSR